MGSQNNSSSEKKSKPSVGNEERQSFSNLSSKGRVEVDAFFKKPDSSYYEDEDDDDEIGNLNDDDIDEEYGYGANGSSIYLDGPLDILSKEEEVHKANSSEEDNSGFFLDEIKRIKNKTEQKFLRWAVNTHKKELIGKKELRFFSDFRTQAFQKYLSDFVEAHIHEDGDENEKMDIQALQSLLEKNPEFLKQYKRLDYILLSPVFQFKKMEIHLNLWSQKKLKNNTNNAATIVASYLKNFPRLNAKATAAVIANFILDNPNRDLSNYKNFTNLSIAAAEAELHKALNHTANPEDRENAVACFLPMYGLHSNIADIPEHPLYYYTLNRMTDNTIDGITATIQQYNTDTTFREKINERKSLEELVYLLEKKQTTRKRFSLQSDPVDDFLKSCTELKTHGYTTKDLLTKVKDYLAKSNSWKLLEQYKNLKDLVEHIKKENSYSPSNKQLGVLSAPNESIVGSVKKVKSSNVVRTKTKLRSSRKARSLSNP